MADDRPRSWEVTEGSQRAPARAMLRAVGFSEEDFGKSQIAVASSWNEVTPCNYHLDKLAALAKEGVRQGGAVPIEFTTIAVSDGIAMGHEGMKASLISREVIADSVELVMHAERFDGLVGIAGCDKSEPAMLMAMARLNLASVYLYGGTILAGTYQDRDITIQDVFEAVGAHNNGTIDDDELLQIERAACPTTGSCAGMYTANTMAAAAEALGMSLPGAASPPAGRLPPRGVRARVRAAGGVAARERRPAPARHPHEGGVRERDRGRDGARRVDERRPAPARDRARGARAARARRLRRDLAPGAAPGRRPAGGTVRDAGPGSRRRRARRDEGAARRGAPARRRDHRHRQDDRARTSRSWLRRRRTATSSGRSPSRSIPPGARRSSAAPSPPTARS